MVRLDKIYTRKGDAGETRLGDGQILSKTNQRIIAIGTVDELNTFIGLALTHHKNCIIANPQRIKTQILDIQHDLFDLGADLSIPLTSSVNTIRMQEVQVHRLEQEIDLMNVELKPLDSFVLPGDANLVSATLHIARTVCRRAEREILKLQQQEKLNSFLLKFINRLSDHLFVMTRFCVTANCVENLWQPTKNQNNK